MEQGVYMGKPLFIQAEVHPGAWKLKENEVWNIPKHGINEVRFEFETIGPWIKKLQGLALTLDGKIFGERSLTEPKESGYVMEGRVSVQGKKYRAFTSSKLFEREDGSLVDVGVLVVCKYGEDSDKKETG